MLLFLNCINLYYIFYFNIYDKNNNNYELTIIMIIWSPWIKVCLVRDRFRRIYNSLTWTRIAQYFNVSSRYSYTILFSYNNFLHRLRIHLDNLGENIILKIHIVVTRSYPRLERLKRWYQHLLIYTPHNVTMWSVWVSEMKSIQKFKVNYKDINNVVIWIIFLKKIEKKSVCA